MNEGLLLKDIRCELGLSQREFAQMLGSNQQTMTLIENGKRGTPKGVIKALYGMGIDFYNSLNEGKIVARGNVEMPHIEVKEEKYKLSLVATTKDISTVTKITELLEDIEEISINKVTDNK